MAFSSEKKSKVAMNVVIYTLTTHPNLVILTRTWTMLQTEARVHSSAMYLLRQENFQNLSKVRMNELIYILDVNVLMFPSERKARAGQ